MTTKIIEKSTASDLFQLGGQVHNGDHHRKCDGGGPEKRRPDSRAGASVSTDSRRIIISRTGDKPKADASQNSAAVGFVAALIR